MAKGRKDFRQLAVESDIVQQVEQMQRELGYRLDRKITQTEIVRGLLSLKDLSKEYDTIMKNAKYPRIFLV